MSTILVTGSSGFIGKALARSLSKRHQVLCMSRKDPNLGLPWIRGEFSSFEDLRQLDKYQVDATVHLAAVTGGCLERDGMLVNVEGTRCLMRYLMDRGSRKFVLASSIAAVGMQSTAFRPLQLPIPDEHPCLDRDGYGFSKYMMEEVTRYYHRQDAALDITNLRLSSVVPDETSLTPGGLRPLGQWAAGAVTMMLLADAVRAFELAVELAYRPRLRIVNAAGPRVWCSVPTAKLLRHWWGADVDTSCYERPGHEFDGLYDVRRIKEELGFVAQRLPVVTPG